jgi:hypothetical protein
VQQPIRVISRKAESPAEQCSAGVFFYWGKLVRGNGDFTGSVTTGSE